MTKLYISGPIKGVADVRQRFAQAALELRHQGYRVVDPFDCLPLGCDGPPARCVALTPDNHYDHYMRSDIAAMVACDGVALLPGWEASRGARIVHSVALLLGMPVKTIETWSRW